MTDKAALDVLDPVNASWDEAIASVRNSAKWLVIATGAAATFIFGAGTLGARAELGSADSGSLAIAVLLGVLGIGFLALLAWDVAKVFQPATASLHDLTDETREVLRRNWAINPGGWVTVAMTGDADQPPEDPGRELMELIARHRGDLAALEQALVDAQSLPGTQGKTTRQALEAAKNATTAKLAAVTATADGALDMERYHQVKATRSTSIETYAFAALALIFALGYQLALSAATAGEEASADGSGATSAPVVGHLGPAATAEAAEVWRKSGLGACGEGDAGDAVTTVPVLITGGDGGVDDPFVVQTVPALVGTQCPSVSLTVSDDYFLLRTEPVDLVVEVTAAPTEAD